MRTLPCKSSKTINPKAEADVISFPSSKRLADEIAKAWHSCFPFSSNSVYFILTTACHPSYLLLGVFPSQNYHF